MRPKTVKLVVSAMGLTLPLAEARITPFSRKTDVSDFLDRVCPKCLSKPTYKGEYLCQCGERFSHWSRLKEVIKGSQTAIVKAVLRKEGESVQASLYKIGKEKFREKADATINEYGILVKDQTSALNLRKLVIATEKLGYVIVLKWSEQYEQVIAVLTISQSGRILVREIMPANLGQIEETLQASMNEISEKEIEEAQILVKQLPDATEDTFKVEDWRTQTIPQVVTTETAKVQDLNQIIASLPKPEPEALAPTPTAK